MEDDHGKSDKIMAIGCFGEVIHNCPSAAAAPYFEPFMQVLIKHSGTEDGSMNHNVAYGFGVLAEKAPVELFAPHLNTAMTCVKNMHAASQEADAKDNCVATLAKIIEKYQASLPKD